MTVSEAFLDRMPQADRDQLASLWTVRAYQAQQLVIAHGDESRDVFFLLEGRARATLFAESGREVAYREIGPGDVFGELSGIDGRPRSASIVALERAVVARLAPAPFREFVRKNPAFAWALLEHLSDRMRAMTDRVYEFSTLVVRKRLIRELLRRAEGHGGGADGHVLLRPAPTHFELASSISTHREAVSREMSALAKRKLIAKRESTLVILDPAALEAMAEEQDDSG